MKFPTGLSLALATALALGALALSTMGAKPSDPMRVGKVEIQSIGALEFGPLQATMRTVENTRWRDGRTGSLQAGWQAVPEGAHVVVAPVDHSCIQVETLDLLLGAFGYVARQVDVVGPSFDDGAGPRRGHPILLHGRLREAVAQLGPDDALRDALVGRPRLDVPVDDPGILLNVDTPAELARARQLLGPT